MEIWSHILRVFSILFQSPWPFWHTISSSISHLSSLPFLLFYFPLSIFLRFFSFHPQSCIFYSYSSFSSYFVSSLPAFVWSSYFTTILIFPLLFYPSSASTPSTPLRPSVSLGVRPLTSYTIVKSPPFVCYCRENPGRRPLRCSHFYWDPSWLHTTFVLRPGVGILKTINNVIRVRKMYGWYFSLTQEPGWYCICGIMEQKRIRKGTKYRHLLLTTKRRTSINNKAPKTYFVELDKAEYFHWSIILYMLCYLFYNFKN